jgi:hypothetical protein
MSVDKTPWFKPGTHCERFGAHVAVWYFPCECGDLVEACPECDVCISCCRCGNYHSIDCRPTP